MDVGDAAVSVGLLHIKRTETADACGAVAAGGRGRGDDRLRKQQRAGAGPRRDRVVDRRIGGGRCGGIAAGGAGCRLVFRILSHPKRPEIALVGARIRELQGGEAEQGGEAWEASGLGSQKVGAITRFA